MKGLRRVLLNSFAPLAELEFKCSVKSCSMYRSR